MTDTPATYEATLASRIAAALGHEDAEPVDVPDDVDENAIALALAALIGGYRPADDDADDDDKGTAASPTEGDLR